VKIPWQVLNIPHQQKISLHSSSSLLWYYFTSHLQISKKNWMFHVILTFTSIICIHTYPYLYSKMFIFQFEFEKKNFVWKRVASFCIIFILHWRNIGFCMAWHKRENFDWNICTVKFILIFFGAIDLWCSTIGKDCSCYRSKRWKTIFMMNVICERSLLNHGKLLNSRFLPPHWKNSNTTQRKKSKILSLLIFRKKSSCWWLINWKNFSWLLFIIIWKQKLSIFFSILYNVNFMKRKNLESVYIFSSEIQSWF